MIDFEALKKIPVIEKALQYATHDPLLDSVEHCIDSLPRLKVIKGCTPSPEDMQIKKEYDSAMMLIAIGCVFEDLSDLVGGFETAEALVSVWLALTKDAAKEVMMTTGSA